jgi:hypothetical protein
LRYKAGPSPLTAIADEMVLRHCASAMGDIISVYAPVNRGEQGGGDINDGGNGGGCNETAVSSKYE